jgi:hypothetical protein
MAQLKHAITQYLTLTHPLLPEAKERHRIARGIISTAPPPDPTKELEKRQKTKFFNELLIRFSKDIPSAHDREKPDATDVRCKAAGADAPAAAAPQPPEVLLDAHPCASGAAGYVHCLSQSMCACVVEDRQ